MFELNTSYLWEVLIARCRVEPANTCNSQICHVLFLISQQDTLPLCMLYWLALILLLPMCELGRGQKGSLGPASCICCSSQFLNHVIAATKLTGSDEWSLFLWNWTLTLSLKVGVKSYTQLRKLQIISKGPYTSCCRWLNEPWQSFRIVYLDKFCLCFFQCLSLRETKA